MKECTEHDWVYCWYDVTDDSNLYQCDRCGKLSSKAVAG